MENKKLFYSASKNDFTVSCFKLLGVDELVDNAYEIVGTNSTTGGSTSLTTNTPQGAIALADNVMAQLT